MLVVLNNTKSINYNDSTMVDPIGVNDPLVLVMDPSKTNFALIVGTPDGRILDIVEFSGNNRKQGPVMDTTEYCHQIRSYLSKYLAGARLYIVATEAAISERGEKQNHITNMTLTEIRATILAFFYDTYGIKPVQINNWSWKHSELPEGYRSPFQKMSKKALTVLEPNSPLLYYFQEDACDAYFMFKYILKNMCQGFTLVCNASEAPSRDITFSIVSSDSELDTTTEFQYSPGYSVQDNINFYANRYAGKFYITVPINDFELDEIYGHAVDIPISIALQKEVKVIVC